MESIPSDARSVKLRKITKRLADAIDVTILGKQPPEALRIYRAVCDDCDWTFISELWNKGPMAARTRARVHSKKGHDTRTVFDIVGQLDERFSSDGQS